MVLVRIQIQVSVHHFAGRFWDMPEEWWTHPLDTRILQIVELLHVFRIKYGVEFLRCHSKHASAVDGQVPSWRKHPVQLVLPINSLGIAVRLSSDINQQGPLLSQIENAARS